MKCKINGFWNNNGTGTNDNGGSFSWNNFLISVSYTDKKQAHMIGFKSKTFKIKAADINMFLALGLTQDGIINLSAEWLEENYHLKGSTCLIDFDDDSNIIDFEILEEGRSVNTGSAAHASPKS